MARTIVLAFGGNAVCPEGCSGAYDEQRANTRRMTAVAARLAARGERVVLTHGNGPQVGQLAIQQENSAAMIAAQPLFSLVAASQGQLGHLVALSLREQLQDGARQVAALVTHVVVDRHDPAFDRPRKPIGPFFDEAEARRFERERGWEIAPMHGGTYRRVVPSPAPRDILEIDVIRSLVESGATVVAAGGGGIPLVEDGDRGLCGVDAVVDKDLAAERLASTLGADVLVIVTDVPAVTLHYGTPAQRPVEEMTVEEASAHLTAGQFPPGSMGPKVTAAAEFVKNGGGTAVITSTEYVEDAIEGRHATRVVAV